MTPYQTLYRKYRSQTFADLVGQEAVSRALQGAVAGNRVAHAYLFSGTRGTGKTTTARLLAKSLDCRRRADGSAEPCNECESCVAINAGAALDLIEIDAASNRGIDEIRDLREKVHLAPAIGPKKIYIIDEAHMLTPDAFNALLKTLEEPPEHVVFILCTTEAQKVPATVLGRCLHFVFRRMTEEETVGHLRHVAAAEGIAVEPEVLALVARAAQGSMRDAIGLLDQLVPLSAGTIGLTEARDLLQMADPELVARLLNDVLGGRAREALDLLASIYAAGAEYRSVVRALMERARDLLVEAVERRDAAARSRLSEVLDALVRLDGEVRRHGEPRFLVEATLVRLSAVGGEVVPAAPPAVAAAEPLPSPASVPSAPPEEPRSPANAPVEAQAAAEPETTPAPTNPELAEAWQRLVASQPAHIRGILKAAEARVAGDTITLAYRYKGQFDIAEDKRQAVDQVLASEIGPHVKLVLELAPLDSTPAARPPAPEEHPLVQAAVRKLEGKVTKVREI
ncbi:MAG TPA: DNA polymerase III subunit gamma/tau [Candidatus Dormibacteraeota bacterium]